MKMKAVSTVPVLLAAVLLTACGGAASSPAPTSSSCTISAPSTLVTPGTLTIGSDVSYPPQEFMQQNVPVGFDLDVGGAMAGKMCLSHTVVNQTFTSIILALNVKKFDEIGTEVTTRSFAEFVAALPAETQQWARIIKEAGIKPND